MSQKLSDSQQSSTSAAAAALLGWFERTAYVRCCDPERRVRERASYKKGFEVRLVLESKEDVRIVRRLLRAVGLRPGKTFGKHSRIVQPVYGEPAVRWFLDRLPSGRERATMGFSANGRRLGRRRKVRTGEVRVERLPHVRLLPSRTTRDG